MVPGSIRSLWYKSSAENKEKWQVRKKDYISQKQQPKTQRLTVVYIFRMLCQKAFSTASGWKQSQNDIPQAVLGVPRHERMTYGQFSCRTVPGKHLLSDFGTIWRDPWGPGPPAEGPGAPAPPWATAAAAAVGPGGGGGKLPTINLTNKPRRRKWEKTPKTKIRLVSYHFVFILVTEKSKWCQGRCTHSGIRVRPKTRKNDKFEKWYISFKNSSIQLQGWFFQKHRRWL